MEAVADGILCGDDVDAHIHHFTDAGHAAGAGLLIDAHDGEGLGIGANVDVRLFEHLHHLDGVCLVLVGDGGAVAAGDTSLPAALHGEPCGVFQGTVEHILGLVDVHIHEGAVFFGHLKADVHMLTGMLIQHFGRRHTAHYIAAHIHGTLHQLFGAGVADETLLRESDQLQVADVLGGFLGDEQTLYGVELGVQRADIDIGAQLGGTVHDTFPDGTGGAGGDVLGGVFADALVHDEDGVLEGFLGGGDPVLLAEALAALLVRGVGLIKVHMGIDKGGAGHLSRCIDGFNAGGAFDMLGDLLIFAVIADEDINDFSGSVQIGILDE